MATVAREAADLADRKREIGLQLSAIVADHSGNIRRTLGRLAVAAGRAVGVGLEEKDLPERVLLWVADNQSQIKAFVQSEVARVNSLEAASRKLESASHV